MAIDAEKLVSEIRALPDEEKLRLLDTLLRYWFDRLEQPDN